MNVNVHLIPTDLRHIAVVHVGVFASQGECQTALTIAAKSIKSFHITKIYITNEFKLLSREMDTGPGQKEEVNNSL